MADIFKINLEPNIDYNNTNLTEIKQKLNTWRLNISEEIKCILFIKNKIELHDKNNKEEGDEEIEEIEINDKIKEKYSKIFNKLEELCIQQINLISECIVDANENIAKNSNEEIKNKEDNEEEYMQLYDKINFTLNNYNKIIDNINKTISSLPYILNLYLIYNKYDEEENKYIRENIEAEEEKYNSENIKNDNNKNNKKNNFNRNKVTKKGKSNGINNTQISKRERMVKFSKSVQNKKFKKQNSYNPINRKKNNNNFNSNIIDIENDYSRENLKELTLEAKMFSDNLKEYVYNNCVKENEIKNFNKIKEENKMLSEEIINIKNSLKELNEIYESQLEKLEYLKSERSILKKENLQLCDYINKKLDQNINDNNMYEKNYNNKDFKAMEINQNIKFNSKDESDFNISPMDFESIEMFKRLNKL